jgi:hypothetical protein
LISRLLRCFLVCALFAAAEPSIFYSKTFPGSIPPYVSIDVKKDGSVVYMEAPNDENAVRFKLPEAAVPEIFALAEKLDRFKNPLESNLKVANMGVKLFRYTDGPETHEAKFNYSLDENARLLNDWFERITETQRLYFDFERVVRFDKLGVNKTILQVQAYIDRNRLIGADRFLPLLDRVAKNDTYLHMARDRAAALADFIRNTNKVTAAQ